MKGKNEIHMNEATVVEALQEYLDTRHVKDGPLVLSVTEKTQPGTMSATGTFIVIVEERMTLGEAVDDCAAEGAGRTGS